jgi:hypothetical protein
MGQVDDSIKAIEDRVKKLEDRMAQKDTEFAVINTKLSAILWGVGVTGTALIGVLIKMILGA